MGRNNQKARVRTLTAAVALLALTVSELAPEIDRATANIRADLPHASPKPDVYADASGTSEHLPRRRLSAATPDESRSPDLPGSLAMDSRQLDALLQAGFLDVLHPEGGLLRIELLRLEEIDALRILHVESEGLRGVITERQGNYFATIATPAGVYTLERRDGHTRLNNQQQLDLRNNPDERDYRHVPLV